MLNETESREEGKQSPKTYGQWLYIVNRMAGVTGRITVEEARLVAEMMVFRTDSQ